MRKVEKEETELLEKALVRTTRMLDDYERIHAAFLKKITADDLSVADVVNIGKQILELTKEQDKIIERIKLSDVDYDPDPYARRRDAIMQKILAERKEQEANGVQSKSSIPEPGNIRY